MSFSPSCLIRPRVVLSLPSYHYYIVVIVAASSLHRYDWLCCDNMTATFVYRFSQMATEMATDRCTRRYSTWRHGQRLPRTRPAARRLTGQRCTASTAAAHRPRPRLNHNSAESATPGPETRQRCTGQPTR